MKDIKSLIVRVSIAIVLLALPINIFYILFSKVTLYSSLPFFYLLGYSIKINGSKLLISGQSLAFVPACVASSAYYLLALLVLMTKGIKLKTYFYLFLSGAFLILLMNILRIDILLFILLKFGENWFNRFHILFWHFVSSIYVAGTWIFLVYKFKVKSIPVYSDFKFLLNHSLFRTKIQKHKKKTKKKVRKKTKKRRKP